MRYSVVVQLFANAEIQASSPKSARKRVEKLLEDASSFKIKGIEFISEGSEITGIFDEEWNEIS